METALWDATQAVNLRGVFFGCRAVGRQMLAAGYGRIVNLASQAASVGLEGHLAYCTSKSGVLGLTRTLALEWGPRGITVNAVSPTVVDTELGRYGWAGEKGERMKALIPTRRFATPAEIAHGVMFLASRSPRLTWRAMSTGISRHQESVSGRALATQNSCSSMIARSEVVMLASCSWLSCRSIATVSRLPYSVSSCWRISLRERNSLTSASTSDGVTVIPASSRLCFASTSG